MSTKTTFKRIALVAVASLGLGVLGVIAPANAAPNTNLVCSVSYDVATSANLATSAASITSDGVNHTYTLTAAPKFIVGQYVTVAGTGVSPADVTNALVIAVGSLTVTVTPSAAAPAGTSVASTAGATMVLGTENKTCKGLVGPANTVTIASVSATLKEYVVLTGGTFSDGTVAKTLAVSGGTAVILTPTAGSITVAGYSETAAGSGLYSSTPTDSLTIVVQGAPVGAVYSSSKVTVATVAAAGDVYTYTSAATGTTTRLAKAAISALTTTPLYSFTVNQRDAALAPLASTATKAVTASITGVGTLSISASGSATAVNTSASQYVARAAGSATTAQPNSPIIQLFSDGRSGKSTVTISVDGVAVGSYDVTFWGSRASYTVEPDAVNLPALGSANTMLITALDANGQKLPGAAWYAASSAPTIASVSTTGVTDACALAACDATEWAAFGTSSATITGLAKGSATFTVANLSTAPTVTKSVTLGVTGAQIASLTWKFDKETYEPGEKVTVTFTALDSDGKPVGDDFYTVWKSSGIPSANRAITNYKSEYLSTPAAAAAPAAIEYFYGGEAIYTFYAPVTSGVLKLSAVTATNASLITALQGAAVSISATVSGGVAADTAQAAADAAAEATDAANAATDAANAAAEAADAATAAAQDAADAVAALSAQVATMMAQLKAQLTALTNLVIKIQRKVKA